MRNFLVGFFLVFYFSPVFFIVGSSNANTVKVTAMGEVSYKKFTADTKKQALVEAKRAALKKYTSKLPTAKKSILKSFKKEFFDNVEDFVLAATVQQDKRDKSLKTYKVVIMAEIDTSAIDSFFIDNSAAGNTQSEGGSEFGALFIARVITSSKDFDAKRTTVNESESSASLKEESASDGTSSIDSATSKSIDVKRSGGSTEKKRARIEYEPDEDLAEDVAGAVYEELVNAGFEPMDVSELDDMPSFDELIDQLKPSGRLPGRILKQFKRAAIDEGWSFLGQGLIDIGAPEVDNARGTIKIPAKVSFRVWSLLSGKAKTAASVRPKVVYGQGADEDTAIVNAYNEAVTMAMSTVVAQLQKKGLY